MSRTALVLFDIDGTLIRRAGPHHRQVLEDAVWRTTGMRASTEGIPVQGMLDRDILTAMMLREGVSQSAIRRAMPDVLNRAQSLYTRRCPDLRRRVCPGVRGILYRLHRRDVVLGLVTGNLSRIGWTKMRRAGLRHYFRFGSFAESAWTRARLATLAIQEARRAGWISRSSPIALVGDHPNDVMAAKANGIRSVAVGTGLAGIDELKACEPDILVPDMRALRVELFL